MPRSRSRSPRGRYDDRDDRRDDRRRERDGNDDDSRRKRRSSRSRSPEGRDGDRQGGSSSKRSSHHHKKESGRRRRDDSTSSQEQERKRKKEKESKKAEKRRLREEEDARQVAELSVYSATDNPFHDTNLNQQFKWQKKLDKEKKMGMTAEEARRRDDLRRVEAKEELERLNKRRAEREAEQVLREEEEARMARMAESAQMAEWIAKDGDFQLEQERRRAGIRLKERRAKAIDFLALNLKFAGPNAGTEEEDDGLGLDEVGLEIDFDEPYAIFDNLSLPQTEELHDDIQKYLTLEKTDMNIDFWTNMMVVCKDRVEKLANDPQVGQDRDVTSTVETEITILLAGKNIDQLNLLQRQIHAKLTSGEPVDTDYWEGLLKNLIVWKAKAKLKALHEVVVRNRLEQLRKRQRDEAHQAQQELMAAAMDEDQEEGGEEDVPMAEDIIEPTEEYRRSMSPPLITLPSLPYDERQIQNVDALEDAVALFSLRRTVTSSKFVPRAVESDAPAPIAPTEPSFADLQSEAMMRDVLVRAEAERDPEDSGEDEDFLDLEELIGTVGQMGTGKSYSWEDKYRPRKPRYFNRVHTGYEWNKYNQTHYDTDNPPPKVVQGYKFNIFYPDLIDKSVAPTYKIIKEPGNSDTVFLRFMSGPPYEDIAFRVVNREWEYSHKRGFKSMFDRGCLSLWFNFRRNFYRK